MSGRSHTSCHGEPFQESRLSGKPDATAIILDSISDGVFTVDEHWCITSFNRAASQITGVARKAALGKPCSEVFRASMRETDCALRRTIESGKPIVSSSAFIVTAEGRRVPISLSTAVLHEARGRVVGGVETFRDLSLVEELRKQIEGRRQMGDLVSRSVAMRRVFDIIPQVAESSSTAFIVGETGTGKELLARAIHDLSPRRASPFIAVNCGALPDTLLESELFGYVAGAFTGADKNKPGRFALAEGGTLFLDEIGDVSPALQVRLLRVLQERTYEPLGGTLTMKCDVRIIAATNSDLATEVEKSAFRRDLFYRINVVRIDLPPLRRRREDIPLLVDHFVSRFNTIQGKSVSRVDPEVMAILMAHDYPGNARELENIIEHAFVLARDGTIGLKHLPEDFLALNFATLESAGLRTSVHAAEAQAIRQALSRNNFNRLAAARELGMHKSTLFRKIKSLGIDLIDKSAGAGAPRQKSRKPATVE
jgi:PAS domain S-box-containing protein